VVPLGQPPAVTGPISGRTTNPKHSHRASCASPGITFTRSQGAEVIDADLMDKILIGLIGVTADVSDRVLDLVSEFADELGDLSHEDVVKLVEAAVTATASTAVTAAFNKRKALAHADGGLTPIA
jgi:hypothetical protein